jgi:hypothetical protein
MGDPAGIAALKSHDAGTTIKIANWAVENLVHRTADVALKEDECKTTEESGAYRLNSLSKVVANNLHAIGASLGVYDSEILDSAGNSAPEYYFNNIFALFNTELVFKKLAGELEVKPKTEMNRHLTTMHHL